MFLPCVWHLGYVDAKGQTLRVLVNRRVPFMRAQAHYSKLGPSHPHASPLFGVWAASPTCKIENPDA